MLPRTLIGASSKDYLDLAGARRWLAVVTDAIDSGEPADGLFWCPPMPLLAVGAEQLGPRGALVGTQDVSAYGAGPHTGEVHAGLLAELGATFVMVGHPERARDQGETAAVRAAKVARAVDAGLVPILIVGEPERGTDPADVVLPQLVASFGGVAPEAPVVVAYEPTWAIGQSQPAPPEHVLGVVAVIRGWAAGRSGESRVLYGGSAGPGTFVALVDAGRDVGRSDEVPDGVFLGRAGLDPDQFLRTVGEVRTALG